MKKISLFMAGAFACLLATAAIIHAVNFSGEWTLNKGKSELGDFGENIAPKKITIKSSDNSIEIERLSPSFEGGDFTTKETLTFDGKETEIKMNGNNKRKSTAKWSADGQSMIVNSVINFEMNGEVTDIKVEETWRLTPEGKLSMVSVSNSSFGTLEMKMIYDKTK
jgi:hypothetical protein